MLSRATLAVALLAAACASCATSAPGDGSGDGAPRDASAPEVQPDASRPALDCKKQAHWLCETFDDDRASGSGAGVVESDPSAPSPPGVLALTNGRRLWGTARSVAPGIMCSFAFRVPERASQRSRFIFEIRMLSPYRALSLQIDNATGVERLTAMEGVGDSHTIGAISPGWNRVELVAPVPGGGLRATLNGVAVSMPSVFADLALSEEVYVAFDNATGPSDDWLVLFDDLVCERF